MDLFDDENEIINFFQSIKLEETALIPEDKETENIFQLIHDPQYWLSWIDSSAHNAPPPDFYNDNSHIMMDVMRVDDHGYKNAKGKTVNPTRQRDSQLMIELKKAGILDMFPNAKVFLIPDTKLPTYEDHNYQFYLNNFVETIEHHKKKISNYRKNHPGYQIIFFVFDESSMYFSSKKPRNNNAPYVGDMSCGRPHLWFTDIVFLNAIFESEIDFLVWFTPYKHSYIFNNKSKPCEFPQVVVINPKKFPKDILYHYDETHIVSAEV